MRTKQDLQILQALPLDLKIAKTKRRIDEFVNEIGIENVYVSFSGGKDSTVLLHLAREVYPDIKAVFADTGLEYPEVRNFARSFENVEVVRPKMNFKDVIFKYGYPIISKNVSHNIGISRRNPNGNVSKNIVFNDDKKGKYNIKKYRCLVNAPFLISDQCCNVMKKKPLDINLRPFIGTLTNESSMREDMWIKNGCNTFSGKIQSQPLSFWTEQDVLQFIKQNNLEIASVYGDIVTVDGEDLYHDSLFTSTCKLKTTGCTRTGCVFCGFGAHLEKESRFKSLRETHPKLYDYCINGGEFDPIDGLWKPNNKGLGMGFVFDWCNENIKNFKIEY